MRGVTLDAACRVRWRPGGASRDRTGDPLLAKQVLSQLSYRPEATTRLKLAAFAASSNGVAPATGSRDCM